MHGVTEPCPECQFDPAADIDPAERFATFAKRYPIPLTRLLATDTDVVLRTRPTDSTWSALEYAGHVAGVCDTLTDWIARTVAEDVPVFVGSDVDEDVRRGMFNDVAPAAMAERVRVAATGVAEALRALEPGALQRNTSFAGMTVPLQLLVVAMVHEGHHHLLDIGRVLRTVRADARHE